MLLTRRTLIAGAGAIAVGAGPACAATASRRFTIMRDGTDIGSHAIALSRNGDAIDVAIDIQIVVRVLGIAAYRYEMRNREVWRAGRLVSVDSTVNDDGTRKRVIAQGDGDTVRVEGPGFTGAAPGLAATTTYFTQDFLKRDTWISTDNGELFAVAVSDRGAQQVRTAAGPVDCTMFNATNGADFDVDLFYDARGELASVGFDAGGKRATYVAANLNDSFAAVWAG